MSDNSFASDSASLYRADNPLMNPPALPFGAPPLDLIKNEHFLPACRWAMAKEKEEFAAVRDNPEAPTFFNSVEALSFVGRDLDRIGTVLEVFCLANNNDALRDIEEIVAQENSRHSSELSLDRKMFDRVNAVFARKDELGLTVEQAVLLDVMHKKYIRAGVHLEGERKERLKAINEQLALSTKKFMSNTVKSVAAFRRVVDDEAELEGLPERAMNLYRQQARDAGMDGGFLLLLEPYPRDIMVYAKNRALREEIYTASRLTSCGGEFDNKGLIKDILGLRHEKAQLLGFDTYASFVLSDRMARDIPTVSAFLEQNLAVYKPAAEKDYKALAAFAAKRDGLDDLKSWDVSYYNNLMKEELFDFKAETLRPYFDLEKVLGGLCLHAEKLFGLKFRPAAQGAYPVYHPDVKTFDVVDKKTGTQIGVFYGDYYARPGSKKGGAWMIPFRSRGVIRGKDELPLVTNNSNFPKPMPGQPTLLSFSDVQEVFHEFGHALHELLGEGRYPELTGSNVKWDFVELPSQLMENWVAEPEVLETFARHYETGEVIPSALVDKIKETNNFNISITALDQTFLGMLDLAYYSTDPAKIESVDAFETNLASRTQILKPERGLMSTRFMHIFSGGYAAGYYGYKWTEVLDADVFEAFKTKGLYDPDLSGRLRRTIFAKGGTVEPDALYVQMMGRDPDPNALYRREGVFWEAGVPKVSLRPNVEPR
ncbi:MAG: M3 family metallopeptidase [Alphaproteobacteria bacterium]|nr:M3 family metallopeptidase [Alphaproteobacteria bacterium]